MPSVLLFALLPSRAGLRTLSQGIQVMGLRQTRYVGLVKVRLQHLLTAAALNVVRMVSWLHGVPHAKLEHHDLLRSP